MRCALAVLLLMFLSTADAAPDRVGLARLQADRISLDTKINFAFDSDAIHRDSLAGIRDVAHLLKEHPEIVRIEVRGHTDSQGSSDYNLTLSQERADEVARVLVQSGISPQRVVSRGFGEDRPLMRGDSERAHRTNRRVEFVITRR